MNLEPELQQAAHDMNLIQLWWTAVIHPAKAFDAVKKKPAPFWGLWVVLVFNLMISLTTNLARYLLKLLSSWLTFLPDKHYLVAELFFLPVLRIVAWLLGAAVVCMYSLEWA